MSVIGIYRQVLVNVTFAAILPDLRSHCSEEEDHRNDPNHLKQRCELVARKQFLKNLLEQYHHARPSPETIATGVIK